MSKRVEVSFNTTTRSTTYQPRDSSGSGDHSKAPQTDAHSSTASYIWPILVAIVRVFVPSAQRILLLVGRHMESCSALASA
jgi:hypothetical protein